MKKITMSLLSAMMTIGIISCVGIHLVHQILGVHQIKH